jgi:hypothetical protein
VQLEKVPPDTWQEAIGPKVEIKMYAILPSLVNEMDFVSRKPLVDGEN